MDLTDPRLTDLAFRVLPVARELARELAREGRIEAEVVSAVSRRIKQLEAGLSPELEFIAAVNWLGWTPAINRIDQTPLPPCHTTTDELKVPYIICAASLDGRTLPLLIEVKRTSAEAKLVWTEKYLTALRRYAEKLNLPLLVAWKHGHIWTLTDTRQFEKKVQAYHLDWTKALAENLMSSIFGDLLVQLTCRISFYLDAEVLGSGPLPQPPNLIPAGWHSMKIQGAGFLLDGKPSTLSNELAWLFFRAPVQNVVTVMGEKTVRVIDTPEPETMFSLTDLALMLLLWDEKDEADWERVVRKPIPISALNVREELRRGIETGVVQYVLEQKPVTAPDFLAHAP